MIKNYPLIVETRLHNKCAFCRYHITPFHIVADTKLLAVCGACADTMIKGLQMIAAEDSRRYS